MNSSPLARAGNGTLRHLELDDRGVFNVAFFFSILGDVDLDDRGARRRGRILGAALARDDAPHEEQDEAAAASGGRGDDDDRAAARAAIAGLRF